LLTVFLLAAMMPFVGIFLTSFKTIPELREGPSPCRKPGTAELRRCVGRRAVRPLFSQQRDRRDPGRGHRFVAFDHVRLRFGMIRFWATMSCC